MTRRGLRDEEEDSGVVSVEIEDCAVFRWVLRISFGPVAKG